MSSENIQNTENNNENSLKKENIHKIDDKFKKSAESIVNKIFKDLSLLGELSIKHKGNYSKEEIEIIFSAIKKKTNSVKKSFSLTEEEEDTFSL